MVFVMEALEWDICKDRRHVASISKFSNKKPPHSQKLYVKVGLDNDEHINSFSDLI